MSNSLRPHGLQPTRLLHPWDFPGKSTGVGCHFLLQGIFLIQRLNLGLPHCRQILDHLSHQGSQLITDMVSAKFLWHQGSLLIFAGPYSWKGFPAGSDGKESACKAGDLGLIPGLGRSPREGNGYPLQYSCLGNSMHRGAWQSTVYGVTKSRTWQND